MTILLFFLSYFNPLVKIRIGVFIRRSLSSLPIKSIPGRLKAITIKSNFSLNMFLEKILNFNFLGS